ncbi:MAG: DUF3054 domain-containing protein [Halobacteriaceae archaeon]
MLDAWPFGVDRDSLGALAPGDVAMILLFVAVGEIRHHLPPWEYQMRYLRVVLPFVVGWAVASLALGAYSRRARTSTRWSLLLAVAAWLPGALVAMGIRDTAAFPGSAHPDFYLVSAIVGGALLVAWRLLRVAAWPMVAHKL